MSVGNGQDVGMKEMDGFSKSSDRMAQLFARILAMLLQKQKFTDLDDRGIKAILQHLKSGKSVVQQDVDIKDSATFEAIMKMMHIPYVKLIEKGNDGANHTIYITRDSDKNAMEKVWKRFNFEMKIGLNEMTPADFIEQNLNQDIKQSIGYDIAEIEVFRRKMGNRTGSFAFIESETFPGKFDIMYATKDSEQIEQAIKDMQYDFAGKEGTEYKEGLEQELKTKNSFDARIIPKNGETLYVVDSKNPNNFISVTERGFIIHSLQQSEQTLRDGSKSEIVMDSNMIKFTDYDSDQLMKYVAGLTNPVILTAKEMNIVKGIGHNGEAILIPQREFKAKYEELQKKLSERTDYYPGLHLKTHRDIGKKYSVTNLTPDEQSMIYDRIRELGLENTVVLIGDSLAYSEKDKVSVESILNDVLYKEMSPLEKIENRLYYEGHGNISLVNPNRIGYVVSANNPAYVIKIEHTGFSVLKDGSLINQVEKESPLYEETLTNVIGTMKEPVALSQQEMEGTSDHKFNTIKERITQNQENDALLYLNELDIHKREEIYHIQDPGNTMQLDSRQKEAVKKYYEHEIRETYVERTFTEKVIDHDFGTKLKQEHRTTEIQM